MRSVCKIALKDITMVPPFLFSAHIGSVYTNCYMFCLLAAVSEMGFCDEDKETGSGVYGGESAMY